MSNPTEGHCYWCHCLDGECDHCPREEAPNEGEHVPDWKTLALADGEAFGPGPMVVLDVNCKTCGRSGSLPVKFEAKDVNW